MEKLKLSRVLYVFIIITFFNITQGLAQTDTLIMTDGEILVGEIKNMQRGVITIETAYSDSDFKVEWDKVSKIRSRLTHLLTMSDGRRFNATINSTGNPYEVILDNKKTQVAVNVQDIVEFKPINDSFWNKISASIDLGFNVTKANNLVQFNTRTYLGYLTKRWEASGNYNTVFSSQDSVANTKRMDANLKFLVFLPKDWFVFVSNDFLQNDEQKLKLRSTTKFATGNYVIHNNTVYFALFGGLALNSESFTEATSPDKQTGEAFAGLEFNMFNTGDLSLLTNVFAYPNLTDEGRVRVDFKFDIKYDLPLDFYIKAGTTLNYDNQPIAGAQELDYVIQTGFGWEW